MRADPRPQSSGLLACRLLLSLWSCACAGWAEGKLGSDSEEGESESAQEDGASEQDTSVPEAQPDQPLDPPDAQPEPSEDEPLTTIDASTPAMIVPMVEDAGMANEGDAASASSDASVMVRAFPEWAGSYPPYVCIFPPLWIYCPAIYGDALDGQSP